MKIAKIRVGKRHRRVLGDIAALASSIKEVGLLHPVVITPNGRLIAGERRLQACKRLGWTDLPVTVVDLDEIVRGEFAENLHRKDFLPSEIVAIGGGVVWLGMDLSPILVARETRCTGFQERIYLDKTDPNILHDEITAIDHALTRPLESGQDIHAKSEPSAKLA